MKNDLLRLVGALECDECKYELINFGNSAKIVSDICEYWFDDNDFYHRDNEPAIINYYARYYYQHGKVHRLDGPAVIWDTTRQSWYIDGCRIDCKDNEEFLRIVKLKNLL
jgi:hypothetical protein